jgi:hypothetical protein
MYNELSCLLNHTEPILMAVTVKMTVCWNVIMQSGRCVMTLIYPDDRGSRLHSSRSQGTIVVCKSAEPVYELCIVVM